MDLGEKLKESRNRIGGENNAGAKVYGSPGNAA